MYSIQSSLPLNFPRYSTADSSGYILELTTSSVPPSLIGCLPGEGFQETSPRGWDPFAAPGLGVIDGRTSFRKLINSFIRRIDIVARRVSALQRCFDIARYPISATLTRWWEVGI